IRQAMADIQPDLVVNSGAYTMVDKAESDAELAHAVNGIAPGIFAEECEKLGASLIHFSTDYVFDGSKSSAYLETDSTNPLGIYGKSKLAGEEAIRKAGNRHIIIRTAWVYGNCGKGNFVKTMLRLGKDREELRVVADQIGSPTCTGDLAAATAHIIPLLGLEDFGTYHYTNSGVCSWYDFAIAIFEEAAQLGFPLKVQRVIPITTAEYPTPAKRPAFSVLSTTKISALLGTYPPHWRQGLRQMLAREMK
ncbi:MAG: dTDP-4-dehydrorhamnose reductase, partial [Microcoleus sp.]